MQPFFGEPAAAMVGDLTNNLQTDNVSVALYIRSLTGVSRERYVIKRLYKSIFVPPSLGRFIASCRKNAVISNGCEQSPFSGYVRFFPLVEMTGRGSK
jgi:hypothetical protein